MRKQKEKESDTTKTDVDTSDRSRRSVLRSISATGFVPAASYTGESDLTSFLSARDKNINPLKIVYSSEETKQLRSEFPNINIRPKEVLYATTKSDGNFLSIAVSVPAGELNYINTENTTNVVLKLSSSARSEIDHWPTGTEGFIKSTASSTEFFRTSTVGEKDDILAELEDTKLSNPDQTSVILAPKSGTYYIDKFDMDAQEIESIVASGQSPSNQLTSSSQKSLDIVEQQYYDDSLAFTPTDKESCTLGSTAAKETFFCLVQVISCSLCAPSLVGGPKAALACVLLVCLGSPTAIEAIIPELENNCVNLAERAVTCYVEFTEGYRFYLGEPP